MAYLTNVENDPQWSLLSMNSSLYGNDNFTTDYDHPVNYLLRHSKQVRLFKNKI